MVPVQVEVNDVRRSETVHNRFNEQGEDRVGMTSFYRTAFWTAASSVVALSVVALGFVISTKVDVGKLQVSIENQTTQQKALAEQVQRAMSDRYPTNLAIADKTEVSIRITKLEVDMAALREELVRIRVSQAERSSKPQGGGKE